MHVYKGMSKLLGRDSVSSPHSLCRENREMRKCENAKMRKCKNAKMRKCENAKMRKCENVKKKGIVTLAVIGKFAVTFGSHVGGGRGNTTGGKRNEWVPSRPVSECERGEHGMVQ